jgi:streptogramin lyase
MVWPTSSLESGLNATKTMRPGVTSTAGARQPSALTIGPDATLWFTNSNNRVRTPFDIAAGPDGNVWFTSLNSNRVGFVQPN